jgi:hypothetical protein
MLGRELNLFSIHTRNLTLTHTLTLKLGYLSKYRPTTFKDTFDEQLPRG